MHGGKHDRTLHYDFEVFSVIPLVKQTDAEINKMVLIIYE